MEIHQFKNIFLCGILLVGTLLASSAFAEPRKPTPNPKYKITLGDHSKPTTVDFADGRQAQILAEKLPLQPTQIKLEMTESTCPIDTKKSVTCAMQIPFKLQIAGLVWTKDKDHPERIGQLVKKKLAKTSPKPNDPVEYEKPENVLLVVDLEDEGQVYKQKPVPENEKWELVCQNPDLLKPLANPAGLIHVYSIAAELNTRNPETQADENRGQYSLEDLQMKRTSTGYRWESIQKFSAFSVVVGQIMHWVVAGPRNQTCELSFSTDISQAAQVLQKFDEQVPDPKKLVIPRIGFVLKSNQSILKFNLDFQDGVLE